MPIQGHTNSKDTSEPATNECGFSLGNSTLYFVLRLLHWRENVCVDAQCNVT